MGRCEVCPDRPHVPDGDVLDHLGVIHPDLYRDGSRHRFAEALAAKFTSSRHRYDRKTDTETVENPEPADRVDHVMAVHFVAGDGLPSSRMVTCNEAAEVCAAVRDEELADIRKELAENESVMRVLRRQRDEAETAIARVRALADQWIALAPANDGGSIHDTLLFSRAGQAVLDALDDI